MGHFSLLLLHGLYSERYHQNTVLWDEYGAPEQSEQTEQQHNYASLCYSEKTNPKG